jgi:multidrug resistance protein MdtO
MKSGANTDWMSLLAPFPGRAAMAWRIALVCALTAMVAMVYGIPEAAISCYLVFFVMKPDAAESSLLAVALSILVVMVVVVLFLLTNLTLALPPLRIATLALSSLCLLFLASASKLGPLGGIIALVLAFAMTLLSDVPFGEAATRGILYAWLMAFMPMMLVLIVSLTVGRRPLILLRSTVHDRLDTIARYLESGSSADRRRLREMVAQGQEEFMKRWGLMRGLALARRDETRRLGLALQESYRMLFAVLAIPALASPRANTDMAGQARVTALALAAGAPVPAVLVPEATEPAERQAWKALAAIAASTDAKPDSEPAAQPSEPFFSPDAFRNPEHLRYAIKTTVAALICYLVYTALDWQDIHTAMITCYVAALGSVAETTQKLILRIIGCLIGAVMGVGSVLFLVPHMASVGSLMVLVFLGTLLAAWVAVGSERISYAGVQIALAFLMTVLQGFGPSIDMSVAMDRVIGILLGNVVLYLVFTQLWPVSVGRRVRDDFGRALERLAGMARLGESGRDAAVAQAGAVASRLAGARNALGLTTLEPHGVRLDRQGSRRLIAIARSAQALCTRLLIEPLGPDEPLAVRLEALAHLVTSETQALPTPRPAPARPTGSVEHLTQLIEGR